MKQCKTCLNTKELSEFPKKSKIYYRNDCRVCYYEKVHKREETYSIDFKLKSKICTKCNVEKQIKFFNKDKSKLGGYHPHCSRCRAEANKKIYNKNPEKRIKQARNYYKNNKEQFIKKQNERFKKKRQTDPLFLLQRRLRNRLWYALKKKSWKKDTNFSKYIGCDLETLRRHIENQFKDGMSWDNREEWHIDHIIPLDSAKSEEELYKLCHYTNLQPLWATDNIKKSNKI